MAGAKPTPAAEVLVDGVKIDDKFMKMLLDVQVRDSLMLPDTAVVRLRDPKGEYIDSNPFRLGSALEVKVGSREENSVATVFKGDIVALEPEFTEGDCVIAARAYDRSYKLNLNRTSRTFQNQTASDMVKAVAAAAGLRQGQVEATSEVHAYFQQSMETDWQFCWRLAAMHNYEFIVEDSNFHFRPRSVAASVAKLEWGDTLLAFKPRMSGMGQAKSVRVANHDPKARQELVGQAQTPKLVGSAPAVQGRNRVVGTLQGGTMLVADRIATSQNEAKSLAQSRLDRMAASFLEADGKGVGNPKMRAGTTITIENVGRFSGDYVLTQTHHTFRGGNQYTTGFVISGGGHTITELLRNGRNGHNGSHADWAASLVIGVVTNNNDPDKMGRVRVKFPALGDNIEGWWARVATLNAGNERGMYMLPQIDDEVVCGFEHGDPRRPFVLGSLFTGKTKIPADLHDAQGRKAMFGVKSDEKVHVESAQAMTFRSKKEMTVEIQKENGSGNFVLDAKGGAEHKAALNVKQTAGQSFTVEANQSVTIKGNASVTVESQGSLTLKGATIDIQAQGPVNVKGAMINLG